MTWTSDMMNDESQNSVWCNTRKLYNHINNNNTNGYCQIVKTVKNL